MMPVRANLTLESERLQMMKLNAPLSQSKLARLAAVNTTQGQQLNECVLCGVWRRDGGKSKMTAAAESNLNQRSGNADVRSGLRRVCVSLGASPRLRTVPLESCFGHCILISLRCHFPPICTSCRKDAPGKHSSPCNQHTQQHAQQWHNRHTSNTAETTRPR